MPIHASDIIRIRNDLALTQEQLATRIGVSRTSVSNWETGRERPSGSAEAALRMIDVGRAAEMGDGLSAFLSDRKHDSGLGNVTREARFPLQAMFNVGAPYLSVNRADSLGYWPVVSAGRQGEPVPPLAKISPLALLGVGFVDVPGLNNLQHTAVLDSDPTVYHLLENDAVGFSDLAIGARNVSVYTIGVASRITYRLMKQTNASEIVAAAQMRAAAKAVSDQAVFGNGVSATPYGVAYAVPETDVAVVTFANLLEAIGTVESAGGDPTKIGAIVGPGQAKELRQTEKSVGSGEFLLRHDAASPTGQSLAGVPALVMHGFPDARVLVGAFDNLRIEADPNVLQRALTKNDPAGGAEYYLFMDYCPQILHSEAFHVLNVTG